MVNVIGKVIQLKIIESRKQKFDYLSNMNMGRSNERMSSSVLLQLYTIVRSIYISILVWMRFEWGEWGLWGVPPTLSTCYTLVHILKCSQGIQTGFLSNEIKPEDMPQLFRGIQSWGLELFWRETPVQTPRSQGLRTNFLFYRYTLIGPQYLPEQSQSPWSSAVES